MRDEKIFQHCSFLLLLGVSLIGLMISSPNAGGNPPGICFLTLAASASWSAPMDLSAAWCSVKVLILCIAFFLVIESVGTIMAVLNRKPIALLIYCLHGVPALGVLFGSYCLMKSLL